MFKNFKIIAHMGSPIATTGVIILDSIISAAIAKETLGDEYYKGDNICPNKEKIDKWLREILDKKQGVYCTSIGIGDNREFITSWTKRWDDKNDDMVTGFKGKVRVDVGSGHFKSYHMPLVLKSYKTIEFYVRGDTERVMELLEKHINFLGKKSSQGYGEVRCWSFEETEEDYSLWKDGQPMRPMPAKECEEELKGKLFNMQEYAIIPPYWRHDHREICIMPGVN